MHKTNQSGFGHIVLLVAVILLAVVGVAGWRVLAANSDSDTNQQTAEKSDQNRSDAPETVADEAAIELQNFGVDLSSVDVTKNALRDYSSNGLKGFYVFGEELSGNRLNPNFEFASLKTDTKIISAIDGVVAFIREQTDSKDYEVFIQPKEGSMWTIGYDHLTAVQVAQGDSVKAGDVLGSPAMQNNGLLRFEIQINKDEAGATTHVCPSTLLASSVKDNLLDQLRTMQNNWLAISDGATLYDLSAQDPIGCIGTTLTPQQAEGR